MEFYPILGFFFFLVGVLNDLYYKQYETYHKSKAAKKSPEIIT